MPEVEVSTAVRFIPKVAEPGFAPHFKTEGEMASVPIEVQAGC
jgi:hypothetical protein